MPQVETVMRRGEKSIPLSWFSISRARVVSRRLSRGSPMPMKTRLRIMGWSMRLSPSRIRATRTWLRISPAVMLRIKPIVPVLQNVQPIAQPICEDTHWAIRTEPSCPVLGRMTVSTNAPSRSRSNSFSVPSHEVCTVTISGSTISATSASLARSCLETSVMASNEVACFCQIHCQTCAARNLGWPRSSTMKRSSSGNVRFRMSIMRVALLCG